MTKRKPVPKKKPPKPSRVKRAAEKPVKIYSETYVNKNGISLPKILKD